MAFGMVPSGWPAPAAEDFPNFIQFQFNGVNLGGPDADTVNFVSAGSGEGFSVTRGEGESANVITVAIPVV